MDQQETLNLWRQGRTAWNAWAQTLLSRRSGTDEAHWLSEAEADFRAHAFNGPADFSRYIFPGDAHFEDAVFSDRCDFRHANFYQDAIFRHAQLCHFSCFDHARFEGVATFDCSTFLGWPSFEGGLFINVAWFQRVCFRNDVSFQFSRYRTSFFCSGSKFGGKTLFKEASFGRHADFSKSVFHGEADFRRAGFRLSADFEETTFLASSDFSEATFCSASNFRRSSFAGKASFLAARSERGFDLADGRFDEAPDFTQAHFEEAPRLDNLHIARGKPDPDDLPARFRALKRLALQAHDHAREQEYFAREIRASRGNPDEPFPKPWNWFSKNSEVRSRPVWPGAARYWFGRLYELFSDFGRSMTRPMIWWLISTFLFTSFYLHIHLAGCAEYGKCPASFGSMISQWAHDISQRAGSMLDISPEAPSCITGSSEPLGAALYLSIRKALPLVGVGSAEKLNEIYACLYGLHEEDRIGSSQRYAPVIPLSVELVGIVQTLISLLLIFLFLLALRNNFRIR